MIETGFSDLNRINRRWRLNHDGVRYVDMLVRMPLYNSWKMNKKILTIHGKKQGKSREWTLNQNKDRLLQLFLSPYKKSRVVIG